MDNIGDILNNLTDDDISQIKNLANSLLGKDNTTINNEKDKVQVLNNDDTTIKNIANIMSALKNFNSNDEKVSFIASLKPLLSEGRQQKADEAMKMLHLFELIPVIKESGLL